MEIKKFAPTEHFVRCTIYGGSGVGKTVFGGTAPKPIFASSENGLLSIVSTLGYKPDYVEINTVEDLQELYKYLKDNEGKHGYETLVIDSLTEINELIKENMEKKLKRPMQIKEWGELAKNIKGIIRGMKDLKMHIIMICQEKMNVDDSGKVINVKPMLNGKNADEIAYMMDIVAYIFINNKGERVIMTSPDERYVSKDRTGMLGQDVPHDFMEWVQLMSQIEIVEEQETVKTVDAKNATTEKKEEGITPADKLSSGRLFNKYFELIGGKKEEKKEAFTELLTNVFKKNSVDLLTKKEGSKLVKELKKKIEDVESASSENDTEKTVSDKTQEKTEETKNQKEKNASEVEDEDDAEALLNEVLGADDEESEEKPSKVAGNGEQKSGNNKKESPMDKVSKEITEDNLEEFPF